MSEKKFTYFDGTNKEVTVTIADEDLKLVQHDKVITDVKMKSKPTTFFKDAVKRFAKNKSSVVGAVILGLILILSFLLPAVLPQDILATHDEHETKLQPKLFEAGTGWWDGCKNYNHVTIGIDWDLYETTGEIKGLPEGFAEKDVVGGYAGISYEPIAYTDAVNVNARGGYMRLNGTLKEGGSPAVLRSYFREDGKENVVFDFRDDEDKNPEDRVHDYKIDFETTDGNTVDGYDYGAQTPYSIAFEWYDKLDVNLLHSVTLIENKTTYGEFSVNLSDHIPEIKEAFGVADSLLFSSMQKPHLAVYLKTDSNATGTANLLLKKVKFSSKLESEAADMKGLSCLDANASLSITPKDSSGKFNKYYWTAIDGQVNLFKAKVFYASYRIDVYEYKLGNYYNTSISLTDMKKWAERGWLTANFALIDNLADVPAEQRQAQVDLFVNTLTIDNVERSPLVINEKNPFTGTVQSAGKHVVVKLSGTITRWKALYPDYTSCPKYIMGTDDRGRDMLKLTFYGLRTSLLLGVITSAVCFAFGLVWGAIAGYFGGWTDILMERFTDILGGIPWIVIMTLAIVLYNDKVNVDGKMSTFPIFCLALCLTGWISTSGITRTQFYRYKDREYILAARTLGASDWRLIFRHILPNAVGTIITSSVLMIPGIIFSEATISYLNLGLQGENSLGLVLSNNQQYIESYPFLIIFPSVIMALIMISFNLFGNGLRDAFNPSLKGED